jgi:hypothetical protein
MAVIQGDSVNLSTAQTGNGDSTNTAVRYNGGGPGAIVVITTVGATPTVTVSIQGSVDGITFYNIPYALVGAPSTFVVTNPAAITTATTNTYLLQRDQAWKFVKLNYSANTNVTLTANFYGA